MRPKGREDLAAFSAREVKEEQQRKETSIPLQKDSGSQNHPSEISENQRKGDACWGERPKREKQTEELVGDQNPGPEAPPRSKRMEQRKCQGRSDGEG